MEHSQFSLRAGTSWLQNPHYREAILGLGACEGPRPPLEQLEILDVLEVLVDGMNVVADIRESSIFPVVSDITRAAEQLARGADRALVRFGSPLAELLFRRAGQTMLVSLLIGGPPTELRLDELEISRNVFFEAVGRLVHGFLEDLRKIAPELARGSFGSALHARLRRLSGRGRSRRRARSHYPRGGGGVSAKASFADITCGFSLGGDPCRLAEWSGGVEGDLHSLLGKGELLLMDRDETIASWQGPLFPAFRALLSEAREVLSALETRDGGAVLHLGSVKVELDPERGGLLAAGAFFRSPPLHALSAILRTIVEYASAIVAAAPAQRHNCYLSDLAEEASELHAHCGALLDGDFQGPRPHDDAGAEASAPRTASRRPLTPHSLRRVFMRNRWSFDAGPLLPGGFALVGRSLLVAGEDGTFALDLASGRPRWTRDRVGAVWVGPRRGDPVLLSTALGLDLVTPGGATAWSAGALERVLSSPDPYLRGGGKLLVCADGRSVTALSESDGAVSWRFVAPGAVRCRLGGGDGGALLAGDTGFLYALDADSGRVRWRARTRISPLAPPFCLGGQAHLLGMADEGPVLFRADEATGSARELCSLGMDDAAEPERTSGRIAIPGTVAGDASVVIVIPGKGHRQARLKGFRGMPGALPVRNRVFLADCFGSVAALGVRGRRLWQASIPMGGEAPRGGPRLASARGLLLVAHDGLYAIDADSGELLGTSRPESMVDVEHMLATEAPEVYLADADGTVEACLVRPHLSVVAPAD